MHDRALPTAVGQVRMIPAMDHEQHDRPRAEVERHVRPQRCVPGWQCTGSESRRSLIAAHADSGVGARAAIIAHVRPRGAPSATDRSEVVHVGDVVEFRAGRRRAHVQSPASAQPTSSRSSATVPPTPPRLPRHRLRSGSSASSGRLRRRLAHVELAGDHVGDQAGAVFAEEGDLASATSLRSRIRSFLQLVSSNRRLLCSSRWRHDDRRPCQCLRTLMRLKSRCHERYAS